MSTKCTLAHDEDFHFYQELGDERHVYLELRGTHFEAGYNRVMVPIPLHIWEVIRRLGGVDLSLAEESDEALLAFAETRVNELIAGYTQSQETDSSMRSLLYFGAERPREEQIAELLEELHEQRHLQQEIKAAIEAIEEKNRALLRMQQP